MENQRIRVGFALCGSFCTFGQVMPRLEELAEKGYDLTPIFSSFAAATDTRFGRAEDWLRRAETAAGRPAIRTIDGAEPIGPRNLLDILVVAPCTGNTLGKLAAGITDTCVTMAAKAHMRNGRPVLIAPATNDGLAASAVSLGTLLTRKYIYFVPFGQDDPEKKPTSLVADFSQVADCAQAAREGRQIQPLLLQQ